ncbi:MAG: metallophosphoesterase family protein [Myxococcota bacterium]|nr:metallophosphoesterase family protein [Myxococcota bacterium]
MRIGLISDVHANLPALEAVLRALHAHQIDHLLGLGDYVGYGGQPQEVIDLLRAEGVVSVQGNHDRAICGQMDATHYRESVREALEIHRFALNTESIDYLSALPLSLRSPQFGLELGFTHGSPDVDRLESFPYIFSEADLLPLSRQFDSLPFVSFIGHSHLCKNFKFNKESSSEILKTRFSCLDPTHRYLITIGSAGQPRDRDPRAVAGIYDTDQLSFEYLRVEYDISAAARAIVTMGLSEQFARRLYLGV